MFKEEVLWTKNNVCVQSLCTEGYRGCIEEIWFNKCSLCDLWGTGGYSGRRPGLWNTLSITVHWNDP